MPAERAPMRKVREVLRLRHALGVSERQIAVTIGVSRSTVGEYLRRAAVIGITWPVPEGLDDAELERRLFTPPTFDETPARPLPDWRQVHKEVAERLKDEYLEKMFRDDMPKALFEFSLVGPDDLPPTRQSTTDDG